VSLSDAELIVASGRDPELFAGLFDRHYVVIAAFLRRRLERSLADELAAETFLRAFDGRGGYDPGWGDARPWLFGIATHLLAHHRRREERRLRAYARAERRPDTDAAIDEVNDRLDARAAAPVLAAGLAKLAAADRDVLLLYAWADLSYEQIAHALGVPVGTVRSRLHRARNVVRGQLEWDPVTPSGVAAVHRKEAR
jgi:RNA polymerase sigma factor (sigma-70 family)